MDSVEWFQWAVAVSFMYAKRLSHHLNKNAKWLVGEMTASDMSSWTLKGNFRICAPIWSATINSVLTSLQAIPKLFLFRWCDKRLAYINDTPTAHWDVSRFAYKSIRPHRGRFVYRPTSYRLHDLSRFAYIQVESSVGETPTLDSKIFCKDRWTSLPTGSRGVVFDCISS